ncbi:MAG: JAB domain-containing protein, partial [Bacteroidota bacterium]
NELFGRERVSIGGTNATVVDLKLVFKVALDARAAAFIAIHNHPSGNLQPSRADIELTERLKQAGKIFDLPLLDHLIISERGYYSFADEGSL